MEDERACRERCGYQSLGPTDSHYAATPVALALTIRRAVFTPFLLCTIPGDTVVSHLEHLSSTIHLSTTAYSSGETACLPQ